VKALLMLALLLAVVWVWRNRGANTGAAPRVQPKPQTPQDMLACPQCGTHFPATEAITGQKGSYCCTEHLRRAEP
jgi:uncharacterized protein